MGRVSTGEASASGGCGASLSVEGLLRGPEQRASPPGEAEHGPAPPKRPGGPESHSALQDFTASLQEKGVLCCLYIEKN